MAIIGTLISEVLEGPLTVLQAILILYVVSILTTELSILGAYSVAMNLFESFIFKYESLEEVCKILPNPGFASDTWLLDFAIALGWGMFALVIVVAAIKYIIRPATTGKAENPLKIIIKAITAVLFIVLYKEIIGWAFQIIKTFNAALINSSGILSTSSRIVNGFGTIILTVVQAAMTGTVGVIKLITGDPIFIVKLIGATALLAETFAAGIVVFERVLSFIVFILFGPMCIAFSVDPDTEDAFKEWLKGILSQTITICLSTLLSIMLISQIRSLIFNVGYTAPANTSPGTTQETDTDQRDDQKGYNDVFVYNDSSVTVITGPEITEDVPETADIDFDDQLYINLGLSLAFAALLKNSEKFVNMLGFKTMVNTSSAQAFGNAAQSLARELPGLLAKSTFSIERHEGRKYGMSPLEYHEALANKTLPTDKNVSRMLNNAKNFDTSKLPKKELASSRDAAAKVMNSTLGGALKPDENKKNALLSSPRLPTMDSRAIYDAGNKYKNDLLKSKEGQNLSKAAIEGKQAAFVQALQEQNAAREAINASADKLSSQIGPLHSDKNGNFDFNGYVGGYKGKDMPTAEIKTDDLNTALGVFKDPISNKYNGPHFEGDTVKMSQVPNQDGMPTFAFEGKFNDAPGNENIASTFDDLSQYVNSNLGLDNPKDFNSAAINMNEKNSTYYNTEEENIDGNEIKTLYNEIIADDEEKRTIKEDSYLYYQKIFGDDSSTDKSDKPEE